MTDNVTLRGVLHFHSETGTEGGYWAFQDGRHITPNVTRFSCARCGAYWDKGHEPDGPPADRHPEGQGNHFGAPYCAPDAHDFQLVSPEDWSYEGLHVLESGDELTIFDKDEPTKVVWTGKISLRQHPLFTEHANGMWIHADQKDIARERWAAWFFAQNPATLTPKRQR
jgi:hypothetical protein